MRQVAEWVGSSDDAPIPDRVKLRIWSREQGRCHLSGKKILPGDKYEFEHIHALSLGGQHRESNIALALYGPHKIKSAEDRALQAKSDRIRKRHAGIKKPRRILGWRRFDGTPVRASRER